MLGSLSGFPGFVSGLFVIYKSPLKQALGSLLGLFLSIGEMILDVVIQLDCAYGLTSYFV
jgi:hypothetical protein